jgi:signal transduction histidine kinase
LQRLRWPVIAAGLLALGVSGYDSLEYAWSTATAGSLLVELPEPWSEVFAWSIYGARVLVPVAFLLATVRLRSAPGPLGAFAVELDRRTGGETMESAVRTALGDPSLQLLRSDDDGGWWADDGNPGSVPPAGDPRAVTFVGPAERPLAALIHDAALRDQPELLEAVGRVLRLALENERLEKQLREQLLAVTESRQRIVSAAQEERRKVERDLHDGAQQRLVGVMLALQEARSAADGTMVPPAVRERLDAAAAETTEAIRELRELARGIHPAILDDEGLSAAVSSLARRVGLPVSVDVTVDGRLARLAESTAYFVIAEGLTNTQRHAQASKASVRVHRLGKDLEIVIDDDGIGGARQESGSGLHGLADRVAAIGGHLEVESAAGRGTRLRATIPTT